MEDYMARIKSDAIPDPQDILAICKILKLREKGQIFKTLADAVQRALQKAACDGKTIPQSTRRRKSDSTTEFHEELCVIVDWFLGVLGLGPYCFPDILPLEEGWRDDSNFEGDPLLRLQWQIYRDRKAIQVGTKLLFECILSSAYTVAGPLSCRPIWGEDDSSPCRSCGRSVSTANNEIVYCEECRIGRHQICYGIKVIPDAHWICRDCLAAPAASKKRRSSDVSSIDESQRTRKRTNNRQTPTASTTPPVDKTLDLLSPAPTSTSVPPADIPSPRPPHPVILGEEVTVDDTLDGIAGRRSDRNASLSLLTASEISSTTILVSHEADIYRVLKMDDQISNSESLFSMCGRKWNIQDDGFRLFFTLPEVKGLIELARGDDTDFRAFIGAVKERWRGHDPSDAGVRYAYLVIKTV